MGLTHGELFAGISGFGLGMERSGIETLWHVEIDKRCQEVLLKKYEGTAIFSDVVDCGRSVELEYADIITFGSPCQDLSIAGKGAGIDGEKSKLFFEAVRIVHDLKPKYAIWENVPGALSSNKGEDFRTILESLLQTRVPMPRSGRWASAGMVRSGQKEIAWRILDAQYFGVPQQRRRVFLIFCSGEGSPSEILFESEGLSRYIEESQEVKEESSSETLGDTRESGPVVFSGRSMTTKEISPTLQAKSTGGYSLNFLPMIVESAIVFQNKQQSGEIRIRDNVSPTVSRYWGTGGNNMPMVATDRIRRMTPTECARLQGFPDDWNDWLSDSVRYPQFGNAVAVPVAEWLGKRLKEVHSDRMFDSFRVRDVVSSGWFSFPVENS